jgi:hypothetical protein
VLLKLHGKPAANEQIGVPLTGQITRPGEDPTGAIAPSARDLRGAQSEQAMDDRGLIGHKTVLKHL